MGKFYCWPKWLPLAQSNGYSYESADRRSKTDMEVGSVLRVNYDTDETTLDCSLILNAVQSQWFEKFERDMLRQGATWFQMPIQIGGCIMRHTVRFASRPKAGSLIGPFHTTYTFKLDVMERKLQLCDEEMDMLMCISPTDFMNTAKNAGIFWMSLKKLQVPSFILSECA